MGRIAPVTPSGVGESKDRATSDIAELVQRAQLGDRPAFDELVRLTYTETYTLAMRLTNNADDAADVVQDAYLRAYRAIGSFRGEAQFTTWLYRITANCSSTAISKRGKHRHESLDAMPVGASPIVVPGDAEDVFLDQSEVSAALARLPANLRTVIVLRDIYDLSHQAIASELGISEVTAKVRLHRARKRLRDLLVHNQDGHNVQAG